MRSVILTLSALLLASSAAYADCNYNKSNVAANCQAAIHDYFTNTQNNQSGSYEDVQKRVDSAKDVLKECTSCGVSTLQDQINSVTTTQSPAPNDADSSDGPN